jgi:hypothetical protein
MTVSGRSNKECGTEESPRKTLHNYTLRSWHVTRHISTPQYAQPPNKWGSTEDVTLATQSMSDMQPAGPSPTYTRHLVLLKVESREMPQASMISYALLRSSGSGLIYTNAAHAGRGESTTVPINAFLQVRFGGSVMLLRNVGRYMKSQEIQSIHIASAEPVTTFKTELQSASACAPFSLTPQHREVPWEGLGLPQTKRQRLNSDDVVRETSSHVVARTCGPWEVGQTLERMKLSEAMTRP